MALRQNRNTLRRIIHLLFLGFFLLVSLSVIATLSAIQTQKQDALIINLAGRQRMLTQRLTWLALVGKPSSELDSSIQLFEQTQKALSDGGTTTTGFSLDSARLEPLRQVILPPPSDPQIQQTLDEITHSWVIFRRAIQPLDPESLQSQSTQLLLQIDHLVSLYEAKAQEKLVRLQGIQIVSFTLALLLLGGGYILTRRHLVHPLNELSSAVQRLAKGDLTTPLPPLGQHELGQLAETFETMRQEVAASRFELEERVAARTRELSGAFELSQEIVAQLDFEALIQTIVERAQDLLNGETAALCLLDNSRSVLTLSAASGIGITPPQLSQSLSQDPAYQVIAHSKTVSISADCTQCAFLKGQAGAQCLVSPLRSGERVVGAVCVTRPAGSSFDQDEQRALTLLANVATIAILNARLAASERLQAEQRAMSTERERLAAELHDHLAQTLGFLNLQTDQIHQKIIAGEIESAQMELSHLKTTITQAYEQVRSALMGLTTPLRDDEDVYQKVNLLLEKLCGDNRIRLEKHLPVSLFQSLPKAIQTQTLLILREAAINACRHAHARRLRVSAQSQNGFIRFVVEDDGVGFCPQDVDTHAHLGLRIMAARAERSGGHLLVESSPGNGTRVTFDYPAQKESA
ncbi:MAG: HAMP domain-containing protein [Chloroflexota bacterium]